MSYIRFGQQREWSKGEPDLYAYPSDDVIVVKGAWSGSIKKEDWTEITMRMLERQNVSDETMDKIYDALVTEFDI